MSKKSPKSQTPSPVESVGAVFQFRNDGDNLLMLQGGSGPLPFPAGALLTVTEQQADAYAADLAYFVKLGVVAEVSAE